MLMKGQALDPASVINGLNSGIPQKSELPQAQSWLSAPDANPIAKTQDYYSPPSRSISDPVAQPASWPSSPDQPPDIAANTPAPLPTVPAELMSQGNQQTNNMVNALQGNNPYSHTSAPDMPLQPPTDPLLGKDPLNLGIGGQQGSLGSDSGILPQASMYGAMMQTPPMAASPQGIY